MLITGITAFMLNSGDWAFHASSQNFWVAFFNPQFLPQTIARTGGALLLSSLYVYLHASLTIRNARLRDMIASRSARPAMLGAVLVTVGGIGWYVFLPDTAAATLASAAVLNVLMALIFALTAVVFVLLYLGPYRNPGWLSPGFAASLCLFGIAAFATGEFIREAVRKPFVVNSVVLANQILPKEVAKLRSNGYLEGGVWTKAYVADDTIRNADRQDRIATRAGSPMHVHRKLHETLLRHCPIGPRRPGQSPLPPSLQRLPRRTPGLLGRRAAVAGAIARARSSTGSNALTTTTSCRPGAAPTTRPNCWPIT